MPPECYQIDQPAEGRLWIMPCPDGGRLRQDIAALQALGVTHLVSMLAPDEAAALGLGAEDQVCAQAGLVFHAHPIADFGVPDPAAFAALVTRIKGWVEAGHGVAVHCRAGIGRSGMVTSAVLGAMGIAPAVAMETVSHARGVSIPDTVEQGRFVTGFMHNLK